MNRREFLATGLGVSIAPAGRLLAQQRRPLNVIFVLADDLGWADTGPYGADLHETPNLDRLAAQSVRFTRAYSASPVCSPTRASIQTGKHPAKLHMTIWRESSRKPPQNRRSIPPVVEENLPHGEVTIAEALREAGYFNAHVGKWHLGDAEHYPETQGYDVNIGGTVWGAPPTFFWPWRGSQMFGGEYRYVPGLTGGKPGEYLTDRFTDEAIRQVEYARDRPFFLHLAYHTVHTPIEGKRALVDRYAAKIRPGMHHQNAKYAAMVHSLDENVGRLWKRVEELGLADRTVIVFTSDNGGYVNRFKGETVTSNHPLRSGKGSVYEGGIRVPLLIRWPGVPAKGAVCDEPVCSIDFYRTILEMTGAAGDAKHNQGVDGLSLAPLLRNPKGRLAREELYFHYPHYYETTTPVSAVVERRWKLLEYLEDGRLELYDLEKDPEEKTDLAGREPARAAELRAKLEAWRQRVKAPMPSPNPNFQAPGKKGAAR